MSLVLYLKVRGRGQKLPKSKIVPKNANMRVSKAKVSLKGSFRYDKERL